MDGEAQAKQPSASTGFDAAARRLFAALSAEAGTGGSSQDLQIVASWLERSVRQSCGLSESEAEETSQEVIVRVLELARQPETHGVEAIRNPGAYLTRLARNRAIDHVRRRGRGDLELSSELAEVLPNHDDEIAALLDASANAALVRAAMRVAGEARDDLTLLVVSTWLDIADELGEPPSSRDVAERAKVSHTSVNRALKRFKSYLSPGE